MQIYICVLEPWTKWGHNKMHIDKWECCYSQRDRYPFLHRRLEKETADPFFWFHDGWGVSNLNTFCKQHKQNAYASTNTLCTVQKQSCANFFNHVAFFQKRNWKEFNKHKNMTFSCCEIVLKTRIITLAKTEKPQICSNLL